MNKKKYVGMLCWFIGAIIWAAIAWSNFSDGRVIIASIQVILSVGFIIKFAVNCIKYKNDKE